MSNSIISDLFRGSKERKESPKSNNRIQHTTYSTHVIMKYFDISFRVMAMRFVAIKVCKVSWSHSLIITWFDKPYNLWYKLGRGKDLEVRNV